VKYFWRKNNVNIRDALGLPEKSYCIGHLPEEFTKMMERFLIKSMNNN